MTRPAGNPDYIGDGMRPEEYEPYLDALAGYFVRPHPATVQAFARNILDPSRNFDFRRAEQGIPGFGAENDPHGFYHDFYAEQLDTMCDIMRELQRLDLLIPVLCQLC